MDAKNGMEEAVPPRLLQQPETNEPSDDSVDLVVFIEASPPLACRWFRGGAEIRSRGRFRPELEWYGDGRGAAILSIRQPLPRDQGEYTCTVQNEHGSVVGRIALANDVIERLRHQTRRPVKGASAAVFADGVAASLRPDVDFARCRPREAQQPAPNSPAPSRESSPPRLLSSPRALRLHDPSALSLEFRVHSSLPPRFSWFKHPGGALHNSERISIDVRKEFKNSFHAELRITEPQRRLDEGRFVCVVESGAGMCRASFVIDFLEPTLTREPRIIRLPSSEENASAVAFVVGFRCQCLRQVLWIDPSCCVMKDGVHSRLRFHLGADAEPNTFTARMEIDGVGRGDAGRYCCAIQADQGVNVVEFELDIKEGEEEEREGENIREGERIREGMQEEEREKKETGRGVIGRHSTSLLSHEADSAMEDEER